MSHSQARGPGAAVPCVDGWLSSGPSPTLEDLRVRVHLIGAGAVGRALLESWDADHARLVCVSDRSGSVYDRRGLDPRALARFKASGGQFANQPGAAELSLDLALRLVDADVVIDCTSTDPSSAERAARRARGVLRRGAAAVFAAKDAVLADAVTLLEEPTRSRVGIDAVLGGTGRLFVAELDELRQQSLRFAGVLNASTSSVLDGLGRGLDVEQSCDEARSAGLLENDARLDLDGTDAALKLAIVVSALEGRRVGIDDVRRRGIEAVDPERVRAAALCGRATRLVARYERGGTPIVDLEEVPRGALLAPSPRNVVYQYSLRDGRRRVHVGDGLGPEGTARALSRDLRDRVGKERAR